jgi:hypothetical protein
LLVSLIDLINSKQSDAVLDIVSAGYLQAINPHGKQWPLGWQDPRYLLVRAKAPRKVPFSSLQTAAATPLLPWIDQLLH